MSQKTLNNKGVALVTVVLFFLVLVILLGGVMFSSISNQGNAMLSKEHSSSYYVAESGLNIAIEKLKAEIGNGEIPLGEHGSYMDNLENYILNTLPSIVGNLKNGSFEIETSGSDTVFSIRSIGTVNNVRRIVETSFNIYVETEDLMKAVYVKGDITLANNSSITGPIASLMKGVTSKDKIDLNNKQGCNITEISIPVGTDDLLIYKDCPPPFSVEEFDPTGIEFEEIDLNDFLPNPLPSEYVNLNYDNSNNKYTFPSLGTGQAYKIDRLDTTAMTFDLGNMGSDSDVYKLFIQNVSQVGGKFGDIQVPNINVIGKGKLQVFINLTSSDLKAGTIRWTGDVSVGETDLSKFQLIINNSTGIIPTFEIPSSGVTGSNVDFVGSIIADDVNFVFKNAVFKGFLGTNGETVNLSATGEMLGPIWIYAPNALVSLSSNFILNGAIIAEEAEFLSGGSLKYVPYDSSLPGDMELPLLENGMPVPVRITFEFINFKEV